jgi:hypothetical protein
LPPGAGRRGWRGSLQAGLKLSHHIESPAAPISVKSGRAANARRQLQRERLVCGAIADDGFADGVIGRDAAQARRLGRVLLRLRRDEFRRWRSSAACPHPTRNWWRGSVTSVSCMRSGRWGALMGGIAVRGRLRRGRFEELTSRAFKAIYDDANPNRLVRGAGRLLRASRPPQGWSFGRWSRGENADRVVALRPVAAAVVGVLFGIGSCQVN